MSVTEQDVRAAAPANAPEDVVKWVAEIAELTTPDAVEFCDGSQEEWDRLTAQMVESGMFTKLNEELMRWMISWFSSSPRCSTSWS